MKQTEEREEYLQRWYKELSKALKEDDDIKLRLEAWQLLNPPPPLTLEEQKVITIPKMNESN